jgi:hypothetical protein
MCSRTFITGDYVLKISNTTPYISAAIGEICKKLKKITLYTSVPDP